MSSVLFSKTPSITVIDNRGRSVRELAYLRHPTTPEITQSCLTHHHYDAYGFLKQSADPRLSKLKRVNFSYQNALSGAVLRTKSADAGITVALNDANSRLLLTVNGFTDEDKSHQVRYTYHYEKASMPGRLLSVSEQRAQGASHITERLIWASHSHAEKAHNLAGHCIRHYDTAGLREVSSIALTAVPLATTRYLLKNADLRETVANWHEDHISNWHHFLEQEAHTTLTLTDAIGAELQSIDAAGNKQRKAYNVAGQLKGQWLTLKGGFEQVIIKSISYSATGQKLHEEHGNGVRTTYHYEPETQRLISIKTERLPGHHLGVKVLQDLRYSYDAVGNIISISNQAEKTRFWRNQKVVPEHKYVYDSLYQLVSASGRELAYASRQSSHLPQLALFDNTTYVNYRRTYHYDASGNLTQIQHHAPASDNNYTIHITVSSHSNRAISSDFADEPWQVDTLFMASGHQKQLLPGQSLTWNTRGELLLVTLISHHKTAADSEMYRYDANSQRVFKAAHSKMAHHRQRQQQVVYLPGLELHSTLHDAIYQEKLLVITMDAIGTQVRALHWQLGQPLGISDHQLRYSYSNQPSNSLELDGAGHIISQEEYYPYGGSAVWQARSEIEASYKSVRYSGKERDITGLYYYGYRYYQPWVGRWLSADPAGAVDGLNLFRMAHNNPVTLFDPDGKTPQEWETRENFKQLPYSTHAQGTRDLLAVERMEREASTKTEKEKVHLFNQLPFAPEPISFNLHAIKDKIVTVYRSEVKTYDPRYMHTHIKNGNVEIYIPSKAPYDPDKIKELSSEAKKYGWYAAAKNFLASKSSPEPGKDAFYNFHNPLRALQFYEQKTENPKESAEFVIKSFEIPSAIFKAIAEDAVQEHQTKTFPSAPYNVDLAAYNQLGLRPHHIDLISSAIIPGSGRTYTEKQHSELMDLGLNRLNVSRKNLKRSKSKPH